MIYDDNLQGFKAKCFVVMTTKALPDIETKIFSRKLRLDRLNWSRFALKCHSKARTYFLQNVTVWQRVSWQVNVRLMKTLVLSQKVLPFKAPIKALWWVNICFEGYRRKRCSLFFWHRKKFRSSCGPNRNKIQYIFDTMKPKSSPS